MPKKSKDSSKKFEEGLDDLEKDLNDFEKKTEQEIDKSDLAEEDKKLLKENLKEPSEDIVKQKRVEEEKLLKSLEEKDIREDVKDVMYKRIGIKRKDILNIQKAVTFIFLSVMILFILDVNRDFKYLENPLGLEYVCIDETVYEYAPNDFSEIISKSADYISKELSIKSYLVLYPEGEFYSTYAIDDYNNTLRLFDITSDPYKFFTKDIPTNETYQIYGVFRKADSGYGIKVIEIRETEKDVIGTWTAPSCTLDQKGTEKTFSNFMKYLMLRIRQIIS